MKSALRALYVNFSFFVKNEWNEYCEGERIVRELTSNDDEKPSPDKLKRLVYLIGAEPENYQLTYMMIMKRVTDFRYLRHMEKVSFLIFKKKKRYQPSEHVYVQKKKIKGLIVVEYILKYGDHRFVRSCKRDVRHFKKLRGFTYELYNKDFGGGGV
ncbi:hypothetical protein RFI_18496 [Reticulomyxa filosa]|uniref:ENTH domain-containing protein n=1 Tax=Reticulomyxa filosa TaxID=46433 RepID=X6MZ36_RETFI|nr:hypothetical protein RFI_18496 [Reticulomyxa filosa]|eukprot:ETO18759.1 hypothetical protein RFI_18496 [Reticulomyxa filosa]